MCAMASQEQEQDTKTIPLKILVDKQNNKVIVIEATKDFVDTLVSFLSLPLGTIIRLLNNNNNNNDQELSSELTPPPFLGCINNLYESVENLTLDDVYNTVCKNMLLRPRNPCEALCLKLFMNVDDTEPTRLLVCDSCNKLSTFPDLLCICGKPMNRMPHNLDPQDFANNVEGRVGVFVQENGSKFLVFDDLKIVPCSLVTSMELLLQLGYSDLTLVEEVTQNIGKQEILNLLKYTLTSHEPLTNTILASNSKKKDNPLKQFASTIRVRPATSDNKMDVKVVRSKSQKKIIFAEATEDFVDFIFSFLTIPLGSIVKLLSGNSFVGCVDNLYKSVETLVLSWCTDSCSVLLNPGVAPQFGCPNQPLNIPNVQPPTYYYGTGTLVKVKVNSHPSFTFSYTTKEDTRKGGVISEAFPYNTFSYTTKEETREGGVISKSNASVANARSLTALDPRSPNKLKENVVGFVKRPTLYAVGDNLKVRPLSANSCISYLKELSHPLDDLEVKVVAISEVEALSLLEASLTSKFALTSGLGDFLNVPKQESTLTSKYVRTSRLNDLSKELIPEVT